MLITMKDGGLKEYSDDTQCYPDCETCDYGSEYINNLFLTLIKYRVHVKTNQMYDYVLSEGYMTKLFLENYNVIQEKTEKEFIDWFREQIRERCRDSWSHKVTEDKIEIFDIRQL